MAQSRPLVLLSKILISLSRPTLNFLVAILAVYDSIEISEQESDTRGRKSNKSLSKRLSNRPRRATGTHFRIWSNATDVLRSPGHGRFAAISIWLRISPRIHSFSHFKDSKHCIIRTRLGRGCWRSCGARRFARACVPTNETPLSFRRLQPSKIYQSSPIQTMNNGNAGTKTPSTQSQNYQNTNRKSSFFSIWMENQPGRLPNHLAGQLERSPSNCRERSSDCETG